MIMSVITKKLTEKLLTLFEVRNEDVENAIELHQPEPELWHEQLASCREVAMLRQTDFYQYSDHDASYLLHKMYRPHI